MERLEKVRQINRGNLFYYETSVDLILLQWIKSNRMHLVLMKKKCRHFYSTKLDCIQIKWNIHGKYHEVTFLYHHIFVELLAISNLRTNRLKKRIKILQTIYMTVMKSDHLKYKQSGSEEKPTAFNPLRWVKSS